MKHGVFLFLFLLVACAGQQNQEALISEDSSGIVVGRDDRASSPIRSYPYSMVLKLLVPRAGCTASLVAPNIAVTAAHCIQSHVGIENGRKRIKNRMTVHTFYDANGRFQDQAEVINFELGRPTNSSNVHGDWALLKLSKPLGDRLGYFQLTSASAGFRKTLTLAGFSYDRPGMTHAQCKLTKRHKVHGILHDCDSESGASGGPMFYCEGKKCFISAIYQGFISSPHEGLRTNVAVDAALAEQKIHLLQK